MGRKKDLKFKKMEKYLALFVQQVKRGNEIRKEGCQVKEIPKEIPKEKIQKKIEI